MTEKRGKVKVWKKDKFVDAKSWWWTPTDWDTKPPEKWSKNKSVCPQAIDSVWSDKPVEQRRWKPEVAEKYYFICDDAKISWDRWDNTNEDKRRYRFGNCFRTRREAVAGRRRIEQALKNEKEK